MADDKHYVPGDYYRICERTGFKVRAGRTRKEWTGRFVRDQSFEPRQPQDFVRGVRDDQTVPNPRPRQVDTFIGPLGTKLILDAPAGSEILHLESTKRMTAGDSVQVMMDNGEWYFSTIVDMVGPTTLEVDGHLPFDASSGNMFVNKTAYAQPDLYTSGEDDD